jgi:hypothetical protein
MSKSGNWYIASTEGTSFTLYAVMKKMGIPLSAEQERCQAELEKRYPKVIVQESER